MRDTFIFVDIVKYVERGLEYRGFQPFLAKKEETEELETFVQPWEHITFTNRVGDVVEVREDDYLNITDLSSVRVVSKEEFDEDYEVVGLIEKSLYKSL